MALPPTILRSLKSLVPTGFSDSWIEWARSLPSDLRYLLLQDLKPAEARQILYDWTLNARPEQLLPGSEHSLLTRDDWVFWLVLAGRGFGKTRVGAETVKSWAEDPNERILMIAPVASDVREVMIEGPSGLLSCYPPDQRPHYNPSRHLVKFRSGAVGITRSADEPERLRGPQFTKFWADELCAWRFLQEAWDQIMFAFRLKTKKLRGVITTTPKPSKVLDELLKSPQTVKTHGSTYSNRANLSETWFAEVVTKYEGTRLGRQELLAEVLNDVPGALWTSELIEKYRIKALPDLGEFIRIIVAVDPAVSATEGSADTGIIVAGLTRNMHIVVFEDLTVHESPRGWGTVAITALQKWRGDRVIGEINNGGDLVEANLRAINPNVPFRAVRATRGKQTRAEPVAALYEQGRVHHVGSFALLESQMTTFVPGAIVKAAQRLDRMDALVWACTDLLIDQEQVTVATGAPGFGISRVSISRF